ncbi:D-inositol-3-phosphate glycosyltransferase [Hoyosella sp. YIM 151337]|nr:D-inositol-3-phosphate glycosyltransferase [Hoyosella sp. YIM 151337]MCW4354981.1 D-inositol-3-phosphate glycosyltransferase [Hoyosella sp. YIM 151337]
MSSTHPDRRSSLRRIAVVTVHTSPLAQPGTGDAGGMNVYVLQTAKELAARGVEVEIFTRATSSSDPASVEAAPGVVVRNIVAGPFEGLSKNDLPSQLCPFTAAVLREEANHAPGYYDLVHSHYWLSGQVGWLARDRWSVPLVHTSHTLAAVKNASLAEGDTPEPLARQAGERQVVGEADRLVVNTADERDALRQYYAADPAKIDIVAPGADLSVYGPASQLAARVELGLRPDEAIVTFVGRIQPLKAPDVIVRAAADIARNDPATRLRVLVVGGHSGTAEQSYSLVRLARELGVADRVTFLPPQPPERLAQVYRASDVVAVPSYSESFGLVAIEAQACGTPVVAADVGGLGVAVDDGVTGTLISGHAPGEWARTISELLADDARRAAYAGAAPRHAARFSWSHTAEGLLRSYHSAVAGAPKKAAMVSALAGATRLRSRVADLAVRRGRKEFAAERAGA